MRSDVKFINNYYETLDKDKFNWNSVWQEINDYILPFKQPILYTDPPGTQRSTVTMFDSTATHAVFRLAAALNSLLTNQTATWFSLETDNELMNREQEAKVWFEAMVDAIMRELENSNFYTEVNEMYIDLVAYGTGILSVEGSGLRDKNLNFSSRSIREVCVAENNEGLIDVVARKFDMTARQVVQEFGEENVSDDTKKKFEKEPEANITIVHMVYPRESFEIGKKDPQNMKYASIWFEKEKDGHILRESGYSTFPFIVSRWLKETGELYGRSPAMNSLPDIKTLNEMVKTLIITGQKIADPPIQVPDEGFGDVTTEPGKIIYYDPTYKARIEPLLFGANLPITFDMVSEKRQTVADAFFMNQLLLIDKRELTAEEVRARQAENARILAPTFGMLNYEFLAPLIERVIDILTGVLDDVGNPLLPVPPSFLIDKKYKMKFISPLAKSQRIHESQSILYAINTAMTWAQVQPTVLDNVDFDAAFYRLVDITGAPADIIKDPKLVAADREARAQAQAAVMQAQQAQMGATTLKDASKGVQNLDKVVNG